MASKARSLAFWQYFLTLESNFRNKKKWGDWVTKCYCGNILYFHAGLPEKL